MKSKLRHISTICTYYIWYLIAFVIVSSGVLILVQSGINVNPLPAVQYNTYQCSTNKDTGEGTFQIYAYAEEHALFLANTLCSDPIAEQQYQNIFVSWQLREQSFSRVIFDKQYQLIVMKPELMERYDINQKDHYLALASYSDYSSKFISLKSMPRLELEYFQNRALGLLDNPDSLSGYMIPKLELRNANIDESLLTILLYESHMDLYNALIDGDVDVIASGIQSPIDSDLNRHHYILPIQSTLRGARWYLHPDLVNTNFHCSLESLLTDMAKNSPMDIDRSLRVIGPCLK